MGAKSSKGVTICMNLGSSAGTKISDITNVTKAKPAVVSSVIGGSLVPGEIVKIPVGATGLPEIDGKTFVVATPVATAGAETFELLGSDTTGSTGTFAVPASGKEPVTFRNAGDMVCLCLSTLGFNPETPDTIAVGTFCDPSATIPGATTGAGTLNFGGYVDINDDDYKELLLADADGLERQWRITIPNNGYIVFPATIGALTWQVPLEGAVAYEGTAVLGSKPVHLF